MYPFARGGGKDLTSTFVEVHHHTGPAATRGVYEIPERGYSDNPTLRVKPLGPDAWVVNLDLTADEYYGSEKVKRALVRYPLHVVRLDTDPERNPFGLALNCYSGKPQRLAATSPASPAGLDPEGVTP